MSLEGLLEITFVARVTFVAIFVNKCTCQTCHAPVRGDGIYTDLVVIPPCATKIATEVTRVIFVVPHQWTSYREMTMDPRRI